MKTRKLVLLICDALLLVVLILQLCLKAGDRTKNFTISDEVDEVTIANAEGSFSLVKENDSWFVGDKKYPANETYTSALVEAGMNIKVLDKVASATSDAVLDRYELTEGERLEVTFKSKGKTVRSLYVGKEANASSQTYAIFDDQKDIYLTAQNLRNEFDKSISYLRSRTVLDLDKTQISSVAITNEKGQTWSLARMGSGTDIVWNSSNELLQIDETKATDWFNSLASLVTPSWYEEGENPGGQKIISAKIGVGFKTVSLEIYRLPASGDSASEKYWASCSETPYPFEIAGYAVQKFQKSLEDMAK